jgi:hypothetical protein
MPQRINSGGGIVGYYYDKVGIVHGFVRSSTGSIAVFDAPGATTTICCLGTFAQSINSAGTVAGYFVDNNDATHAFIRTAAAAFTTIDVTGNSGMLNDDVNDGGVVAGTALDSNSHAHGFVRALDGSFATFNAPGVSSVGSFTGTVVQRINSQGAVLGYFDDTNFIRHGFLRAPDGTISILDAANTTPPCNCGTQPTGMNTSGQIVGFTYSAGVTQDFVRSVDGTYTLFAPPNAVTSGNESGSNNAVAINDNGAIVGNYPDSTGHLHGYVRNSDGTFTILDDPEATGIGSFGTATTDIGPTGAVIGYYGDSNRAYHGYVWQ